MKKANFSLSVLYLVPFFLFLCVFTHIAGAEGDLFGSGPKALNMAIDKGILYLETGLYDRAIDYFSSMKSEYPESPIMTYYLGLAYYGKEDIDSAEKLFKQTIELDPYSVSAYYHLALIESKKGNGEQVIHYFDKVTSMDDTFQSAYYNKGVIFLSIGEPENAIREFAYALYLSPGDKSSFAGLIKAYAKLGQEVTGVPGIENDKKARPGEVRISFSEENADFVESEKDGEDKMRIYLVASSGKREIESIDGEPLELRSENNAKCSLEINFPSPRNLQHKLIRFKAKGSGGGEKMNILVRDNSLRRSPNFYLKDIDKDWKTFDINVREVAYNLNRREVEQIKIELLTPSEATGDNGHTIFVKDLEII